MNKIKCSILAIGDELITGKIVDSNSSFIAKELTAIGFSVVSIQQIGDNVSLIVSTINELAKEVDFIVTTGGLGPTLDDKTRDALAIAADQPLVLFPGSEQRLIECLKQRNRICSEVQRRQAYFPEQASILENIIGTADGFSVKLANQTIVFSMPGVPKEMKTMMQSQVLPQLQIFFPNISNPYIFSFRCFGLSESYVASQIETLELVEHIEIAYRPSFPILTVSLSDFSSRSQIEKKNIIEKEFSEILRVIGEEYIFTFDPEQSIASVVQDIMLKKNLTLALAESCTGGLVADRIVFEAGSSGYFSGGVVCYSNKVKQNFLGVAEQTLKSYGAVSEQTAAELAEGVRKKFGTSYGISITGIAGPGGGSEEKPIGTVCFGLSTDLETIVSRVIISRNRNEVRAYAAIYALDMIRRHLLELPQLLEINK